VFKEIGDETEPDAIVIPLIVTLAVGSAAVGVNVIAVVLYGTLVV
jgi:hypothetical protein